MAAIVRAVASGEMAVGVGVRLVTIGFGASEEEAKALIEEAKAHAEEIASIAKESAEAVEPDDAEPELPTE